MQLPDNQNFTENKGEETSEQEKITGKDEQAEVEDTDPPLDEEDLEENDLTVEEADQIEWDPPKTSSAGSEEKDITDLNKKH